jgi:hypothetical protein
MGITRYLIIKYIFILILDFFISNALANFDPLIIEQDYFEYNNFKQDAPCLSYENINYDACDSRKKYYAGHGLEALQSNSLANYLSSYNIDTSYVCFNHHMPSLFLKDILFVWYSKEEIPKKIIIDGLWNNNKTEIYAGNVGQIQEINGYFFSIINLNLKEAYNDGYLVRVLEAGEQNRLIVRAIIPNFFSNQKSEDELLELASSISEKMLYGYGVHKDDIIKNGVPCEKTAIRDYILSAKSAHCGNFSYVFAHDLPSSYTVTSVGLHSMLGATHNVTEVYDGEVFQTVDATLGLIYPCTIAELIDGSCAYEDAKLLKPINPIFRGYCGIRFFYNATIISKAFSIDRMKMAYCAKSF